MFTPSAPLLINYADPTTYCNVVPEWLTTTDYEEPILGFSAETATLDDGERYITGYMLFTESAVLFADTEGTIYRAKVIHPLPL